MWDSQTETATEADDFYVFFYDDQDDKGGKGPQTSKKHHHLSSDSQRVLGFWCFNAGVGFKKIQ